MTRGESLLRAERPQGGNRTRGRLGASPNSLSGNHEGHKKDHTTIIADAILMP